MERITIEFRRGYIEWDLSSGDVSIVAYFEAEDRAHGGTLIGGDRLMYSPKAFLEWAASCAKDYKID